MLFLYYALEEQAERERKRILIDTILTISTISAAALCRKSGVQPANLSRLRKLGGENQVSEELQDQLLVGLGWGGGVPNLDAFHDWRIRDRTGLMALEWLLKDRASADARIERKIVASYGFQRTLDIQWTGNLAKNGAPCAILIRSGLSLPSGQTADDMMSQLTSIAAREGVAAQRDVAEKMRMNLTDATLRYLLRGDLLDGMVPTAPGSFLANSVALGLPLEILEQVAHDWTCRTAREEPEKLLQRLSKINNLKLGYGEVFPSSMTKVQLERLVQKLASSSQPND
jgi:hypothetical protein